MKIKIIVEGKSDEIFLKSLLRKFNIRDINIEISGGKNKCEITNPKTIRKIIENAREDGYKKIIILVDKVTQFYCGRTNSSCVLDVKEEYKKRVLKDLNADIVVVDEEIECWFILGENVKNYYKDCYSKIKELFNSTAQQQIAQRAVKKLDLILKNKDKNRSFEYFLEKIGITG